jgi:hypothetical protein
MLALDARHRLAGYLTARSVIHPGILTSIFAVCGAYVANGEDAFP